MLPEDLPGLPILLREARGSFALQIRIAIKAAGLPPLPKDGALVIGGLHNGFSEISLLLRQRGQSTEESPTLQRLFDEGYLEGDSNNPSLTEIGHEAAHIIREAVELLTQSLKEKLGEAGYEGFILGLLFLIEHKEKTEDNLR